MRGLSPIAASGGHSSSRCAGLSLSQPLLLRSTGSRRAGSVIVAHGPICSAACGIFPDQGSNPCPPHWQADSQPLRHQGSPSAEGFCWCCCLATRLALSCGFRFSMVWGHWYLHLVFLFLFFSLTLGISPCLLSLVVCQSMIWAEVVSKYLGPLRLPPSAKWHVCDLCVGWGTHQGFSYTHVSPGFYYLLGSLSFPEETNMRVSQDT